MTLPCPALGCDALPFLALSCPVLHCPALPCHALPYPDRICPDLNFSGLGSPDLTFSAPSGGRVKSWKRRWFILNDNCLYYFEYTTDKEPRGIIPLENIQVGTSHALSTASIINLRCIFSSEP